MNWQQALVLVIVAAAGAFLGWRVLRSLRPAVEQGCSGGCGCAPSARSSSSNFIPLEKLRVKAPPPNEDGS